MISRERLRGFVRQSKIIQAKQDKGLKNIKPLIYEAAVLAKAAGLL